MSSIMEQRKWRWTDAHFCSLPSQTNIYGCTKILNNLNGTNKLLVASLVGKFFTIDYQRIFDKLTPSTKEVQFTYIPGESEIVSVDATNKCAHGNGLTIGITFWKIEDNESKQFLHIYYASQSGEEFNLESVAQGCQSFELLFVPYHLTHTQLITENSPEPVFMLSGSDCKIHMFQEVNDFHSFKEFECEDFFPELKDLPSVVLWLDILYYKNNSRRITACGFQNGLLSVSVVNVKTLEIIQKYSLDFDNPITYVKIFSLYNEVHKPSFIPSYEDQNSASEESPSSSAQMPEFHILVLSALLPATVFRDILHHGLREPVYLPESNKFDAVLTGCVIDIDFDGENEILIGTYGQEVLAYKMGTRTHHRTYKISTASDTDTDEHSPVKQCVIVDETEIGETPVLNRRTSRRVKSQENLSSSLASDTDYVPLSSSKDTVISVQRREKSFYEELDVVECKLLWQRSFACPVIGINKLDIMGDGMEDLVIVTLKGIHILQPDMNEVATVCLERLRILAKEDKEDTSSDIETLTDYQESESPVVENSQLCDNQEQQCFTEDSGQLTSIQDSHNGQQEKHDTCDQDKQ